MRSRSSLSVQGSSRWMDRRETRREGGGNYQVAHLHIGCTTLTRRPAGMVAPGRRVSLPPSTASSSSSPSLQSASACHHDPTHSHATRIMAGQAPLSSPTWSQIVASSHTLAHYQSIYAPPFPTHSEPRPTPPGLPINQPPTEKAHTHHVQTPPLQPPTILTPTMCRLPPSNHPRS